MAASYGGNQIFGLAVSILMVKNPSEFQISTFFGVHGTYSLFGGQRGRVFLCSGVFYGDSRSSCESMRANFESFDDGIGRVLVDTGGNSWSNVVFDQLNVEPKYNIGPGVITQAYKAIFQGRI